MAHLTLLSVPIGNLSDLTKRGREKLEKGKIFLSEDTRTFKMLLNLLEIDYRNKKILSFHDQSKENEINNLIRFLEQEEEVIYVSEAGSPVISDPAYPLIQEVLNHGFEIETVPGVSSPLVALELSGLPTGPFHFYGFLSREKEKRRSLIANFKKSVGTYIIFEAPGRVLKTLKELTEEFPQSNFSVCRELTKKFQSVHRFKGKDFLKIKEEIVLKGEFVILFYLEKANVKNIDLLKVERMIESYINEKKSPKKLAKIFAEILREDSKEIYRQMNIEN